MSVWQEIQDAVLRMEGLLNTAEERRIRAEREVKTYEQALAQATAMIETLMNELAEKAGETDNVLAARIAISILKGYTPPFSPSEEIPHVSDLPRMKHYFDWIMARREDAKKVLKQQEDADAGL